MVLEDLILKLNKRMDAHALWLVNVAMADTSEQEVFLF